MLLNKEKLKQIALVLDFEGGKNSEPFPSKYDSKFQKLFIDVITNRSLADFIKCTIEDQIAYRHLDAAISEDEKLPWFIGDEVSLIIPEELIISDLKFPDEDFESSSSLPFRKRDRDHSQQTATTEIINEIFYTLLSVVFLIYKDEKIRPSINLKDFLFQEGELEKYLKNLCVYPLEREDDIAKSISKFVKQVVKINPRLQNSRHVPRGFALDEDESAMTQKDKALHAKIQIILVSYAPESFGHVSYHLIKEVFFPDLNFELQGKKDRFTKDISDTRNFFHISQNQRPSS